MRLFSKALSGPKIEAFLKILPFLKETFGNKVFAVDEAIRRVNAQPDLRVWCHKSSKVDQSAKDKAQQDGLTTLDLQNACHCFAGGTQSSVTDLDTGEEFVPLQKAEGKRMAYQIVEEQEEGAKESHARKRTESTSDTRNRATDKLEIDADGRALTEIGLANFKAFGGPQTVPIRPLTLLFGPNSAGKSSVIHSLLLGKHCIEGNDVNAHVLSEGGGGVDLGGFQQYVFQRDRNLNTVWSATIGTGSLPSREIGSYLGDAESVRLDIEVGMGAFEFAHAKQLIDPSNLEPVWKYIPTGRYGFRHNPAVVKCTFIVDGQVLATFKRIDPLEGEEVYWDEEVEDLLDLQRSEISKRWGTEDVLRPDYLNVAHPIIRDYFEAVLAASTLLRFTDRDYEFLSGKIQDVFARSVNLLCSDFLPMPVPLSPDFHSHPLTPGEIAVAKGARHEQLGEVLELFVPRIFFQLSLEVTTALRQDLESIKYLGPIRVYPARHFTINSEQGLGWKSGGGVAWDRLVQDERLLRSVNEWLNDKDKLDTHYRLWTDFLVSGQDIVRDGVQREEKRMDVAFREFKDRAFEFYPNFGKGAEDEKGDSPTAESDLAVYIGGQSDSELHRIWETAVAESGEVEGVETWYYDTRWYSSSPLTFLELRDDKTGTNVSHRDVGVGISQVLPVLVYALAPRTSIVAIEGPEQHLHPGLQAKLADVFITAAKEHENTFILETHSEHLILRLLRRIRETNEGRHVDDGLALTPSDVSVVYAQPSISGEGTVLHHLEISDEGEFESDWPDGFFEERDEEIF